MTYKPIKIKGKKKEMPLAQKDVVAQVLKSTQGVYRIMDISSTTSDGRVLTFDCQLEHPPVLSAERLPDADFSQGVDFLSSGDFQQLDPEEEGVEYLVREWFQRVVPEDVMEEMALEVEYKLHEVYRDTKVQMAYHIYQIGEISEPIHAVLSIDFGSLTKRELDSMARTVAMRQMMGQSKYIN